MIGGYPRFSHKKLLQVLNKIYWTNYVAIWTAILNMRHSQNSDTENSLFK